jgi:NAD-dependent deacetylase
MAASELRHAKRVLAITGAGISADSGLPTYRGIGGLYSDGKETEDGMTIEEALSGDTMRTRPDVCWKYIYQIESACRIAKHNAAHKALADLESKFEHFTVLTQNVDGLHRSAGSKNLIEIHGNIQDLFCTSCGHETHVTNFEGMKIPPDCERCGSLVRPHIVLFGEMLPMRAVTQLYEIMEKGLDAVISIGTTSVFPYIAEPVLRAARSNTITIEINPGDTEVSHAVRYRLRDRAVTILPELLKHLS